MDREKIELQILELHSSLQHVDLSIRECYNRFKIESENYWLDYFQTSCNKYSKLLKEFNQLLENKEYKNIYIYLKMVDKIKD